MPLPKVPTHRWFAALLLALGPALPAAAGEHRLTVSATILSRCGLAIDAPGLQCSGSGAPVRYRTLAATGGVVTIEF